MRTKCYLLLALLIVQSMSVMAAFKPKKSKLEFEGMKYVRYETEHIVLICQDGREKKYANNLEKVWEETVKLIPQLKEYGKPAENSELSNKIFVFFFKDNENYNTFGKWYIDLLSEKMGEQVAARAKLTWDHSNVRMVSLPPAILEELMIQCPIGAAAHKLPVSGKYAPSLTHVSAALVNLVPNDKFPNWILIGYAYYLEIDICRKSTTTYLSVEQMSQSGGDEESIVRSKVFSGGKSWIKVIKKLFKDKKFTPFQIKSLAITTPGNLTPEKAGFLYALTHYLINGKFEKGTYNEFMKKVYEGGDPQKLLLEVYGFETIEDFEKAWYAYIKSSKFR